MYIDIPDDDCGCSIVLELVLYTDDGLLVVVNVVSCNLSHNEGSSEIIGVRIVLYLLYSLT